MTGDHGSGAKGGDAVDKWLSAPDSARPLPAPYGSAPSGYGDGGPYGAPAYGAALPPVDHSAYPTVPPYTAYPGAAVTTTTTMSAPTAAPTSPTYNYGGFPASPLQQHHYHQQQQLSPQPQLHVVTSPYRPMGGGAAALPPVAGSPNGGTATVVHTTTYAAPGTFYGGGGGYTAAQAVAMGLQPPRNECSAGWWLFGFGFLLPLLWIVGVCLPSCTKNYNDARAARASMIALMVCLMFIPIITINAVIHGRRG